MTTLKELRAQREALDQKIADAEKAAKNDTLDKIRALIEEAGLSQADVGALFQSRKAKPSGRNVRGKVAAKYRDPASGATWSGRGLKPNWLKAELEKGKAVEDFAV